MASKYNIEWDEVVDDKDSWFDRNRRKIPHRDGLNTLIPTQNQIINSNDEEKQAMNHPDYLIFNDEVEFARRIGSTISEYNPNNAHQLYLLLVDDYTEDRNYESELKYAFTPAQNKIAVVVVKAYDRAMNMIHLLANLDQWEGIGDDGVSGILGPTHETTLIQRYRLWLEWLHLEHILNTLPNTIYTPDTMVRYEQNKDMNDRLPIEPDETKHMYDYDGTNDLEIDWNPTDLGAVLHRLNGGSIRKKRKRLFGRGNDPTPIDESKRDINGSINIIDNYIPHHVPNKPKPKPKPKQVVPAPPVALQDPRSALEKLWGIVSGRGVGRNEKLLYAIANAYSNTANGQTGLIPKRKRKATKKRKRLS